MEPRQMYIEEIQIPQKELEKVGLKLEYLKTKPDILNDLLNGDKTKLLNIQFKDGKINFSTQAKLRLSKDPGGNVTLNIHGVRKNPDIRDAIGEYKLSPEDKDNLLKYGSNFNTVDIGNNKKVLLGIDPDTKEFAFISENYIQANIPKKMLGVELTAQEQEVLKRGGAVKLAGLQKKDAENKFEATVYFSAGKKGLAFTSQEIELKKYISQTKKQETPIVEKKNKNTHKI